MIFFCGSDVVTDFPRSGYKGTLPSNKMLQM